MSDIQLKSGIVALAGRSNVGKSTLLNALVGTKLAITSAKPQTTRHLIQGIVNRPEGQIVFVDTPGFLTENRSSLTGKLVKKIHEALKGVNLILYIVDPSRQIGPEERHLQSILKKTNTPKILVINKIDLPPRERPFLEDYRALSEEFDNFIEISALQNKHLKSLLPMILARLPEDEPLYPPDRITDIEPRFFTAEVIREKVFNTMGDEVPYSTTVEIEEVEDKKDILVIKAVVLTLDERYKKMIIGQGARKIKEIGSSARKELELVLNRNVFLDLRVEVDKDWERKFI